MCGAEEFWECGLKETVQTIRVNVMIQAPVERCFQLVLSAELARDAMDGWRTESESEERRVLGVDDVLRWGAERRIRTMGSFAETITGLRARTFVRRSFAGPRFAWGEGEEHFARMDDGTRVRHEIRFASRPGMLHGFRERRLRKAIQHMMLARSNFLKAVAEGDGWRHYLDADTLPELGRLG